MESISIREFYKGRNILVTGGTGFMGKVLIEKLLYTIPDIGTIYVLLRPKREKGITERIEDMFRLKLFERIRLENPEALNKIKPIHGDVLLEQLGLFDEEIEILANEVSVVFHFAATLRLEAPLRDNVNMNTGGTRRVLGIARVMKHLAVFVHLSTAFCYPDYKVLGERLHAPPINPSHMLKLVEWLNDNQLDALTPSLLGRHPNCYTFSKRLAESVVADAFYNELPVVIARPSIVCPALKNPVPGWVDSLNGPVGLMIAAGKGVVRTMLCDGSLKAQVIPVDIAINGVIAIGFAEGSRNDIPQSLPVYNLNVGHQHPTTWAEVLNFGKQYNSYRPLAWPLWYPNGDITTNAWLHEFRRVCYHLVPAYLVDFLLMILGQRRILVRIQQRISQGLQVLQYFTMRPWSFPCPNYDSLHEELDEEEQEIFRTNIIDFDRDAYLANCVEGGRVYCLHEDPDNNFVNKAYYTLLYILDWIFTIVFWLLFFSFLASWCEPVRKIFSYEPVVKHLPVLGSVVFKDE